MILGQIIAIMCASPGGNFSKKEANCNPMVTNKNKHKQPGKWNPKILQKQTMRVGTRKTNNSERRTEQNDTDVFTNHMLEDSHKGNKNKNP